MAPKGSRGGGLKLQARFMLYFGLTVFALMTAVIVLVGSRQSRTLLRLTEMRGEAVASSIASAVGTPLMSYDYLRLQHVAQTAASNEGVLYVILLDKENLVAGYSNRPSMQGKRLADAVSLTAKGTRASLVQRVDSSEQYDQAYLDISIPVRIDGSPVDWGWVRVGLSLDTMHNEVAATRRLLVLLGFTAGALVVITARVLSGQFTRPLERLVNATTTIASGQLDHKVSEDLPGELAELARSFNTMTGDLERTQDAIRYQNQHLENMVQERTAALRDKARELERANAELKEIDRLKSDFLSNVSHELRTPLTSIRSFTEILMDSSVELPDEERVEFLQIVAGQAKRLTRLINDLLDLSKIEAGEFTCHLGLCDLKQNIFSTIDTLSSLARERGVRLTSDLDEDLPKAWADSDRVSQVLTNLVDNALKFTPEGGTVNLSARRSPHRRQGAGLNGSFAGVESDTPEGAEYVIMAVRDTGAGIEPKDQQRIFEKFGQVGNVLTDKPQGTGLGLAISGAIAAQHGGALWVESEPGDGSVFAFSVPVASDTADGVLQLGPADSDGESEDPGIEELVNALERQTEGRRILIVDDEPAMVSFLTVKLEQLGFRAVGCFNGSQAMAKARDIQPDAIILDLVMPEITGYDVLRLLKGDAATMEIPVIALSTREAEEKIYELGAAELVRKRFRPAPTVREVSLIS